MKRHNSNATPLLVGAILNNQIKVWCPYCKKYHYHSWNANNAQNDVEHRGSHCDDESPLRDRGYYIGIAP